MPVPTYDKFIDPLLRVLNERPQGIRTSEAFEFDKGARAACPQVAKATTEAALNSPIANRKLPIANVIVSPTSSETIAPNPRANNRRTTKNKAKHQARQPINKRQGQQEIINYSLLTISSRRHPKTPAATNPESTISSFKNFRLPRLPGLPRLFLIDHEIGISRKAVYVPKLDSDYFGE